MTSSVPCPDAVQKAAIDGMRKRASARGFFTPKLRKANLSAIELRHPHRVAFVPLNALLSGANLSEATRIAGWRLFISESTNLNEPIAAAYVALTNSGGYRLSELNEGQFVASTMNAFQTLLSGDQAAFREESQSPAFELLLLTVPAVYFVGLWARFDCEDDDWVLPVHPTTRGLKCSPISPAKLLPILRDEAERSRGNELAIE